VTECAGNASTPNQNAFVTGTDVMDCNTDTGALLI
jgi:hypothetical protein